MAESLDDGEFWLPPQFLTDDDLVFDKKRTAAASASASAAALAQLKSKTIGVFAPQAARFAEDLFPLEFPYGFDIYGGGVSSDLSSPVDSLNGSAEHSDEEDLLSCKMAGCSVVEGDLRGNDVALGGKHTQGWTVSVSPQSTLCGLGSDCRCRELSGHGSPTQCPKPPATWDLLRAAAGEVAGMRIDDEGCILSSHNRGISGPPKKPSPILVKNSNPDFGLLQQQSIAYQKLQAAHFIQLRQQQMMKNQGMEAWRAQPKSAAAVYSQQAQPVAQTRGRNLGKPIGLSPSVWPPIQQAVQHRQDSSAMRAVFLPNRAAKRECAGTGVFLPRQIGTPAATESRKKSVGATVILSAKVVHALKLDDGGQKRLNGAFHTGGENAPRPRNCNVQKRNIRPQAEFTSGDVRLPQEWTY